MEVNRFGYGNGRDNTTYANSPAYRLALLLNGDVFWFRREADREDFKITMRAVATALGAPNRICI